MAKKKHWAASTDDPTAGRKFRLACGRWAWINSANMSGPLWSLCSAAVYRDLAACDPDWYCSDCAKAARLALAAESAPKPDARSDSDRYTELRKLVEDCQRKAMDRGSPLVAFENALRFVLYWRHR